MSPTSSAVRLKGNQIFLAVFRARSYSVMSWFGRACQGTSPNKSNVNLLEFCSDGWQAMFVLTFSFLENCDSFFFFLWVVVILMTRTNLPASDCLFKILVIQKCILRNISVPLSLGFLAHCATSSCVFSKTGHYLVSSTCSSTFMGSSWAIYVYIYVFNLKYDLTLRSLGLTLT